MSHTTKNYSTDGGDTLHIGGKLEIEPSAELAGLPVAEHQADSDAGTIAALKEDFNSLLAKLIAAGLMAEGEEE